LLIFNTRSEPSAVIFNIQRFSIHDGPGIRTVVFFKGCPLSCRWCHNPESQNFGLDVLYSAERCRLCAACVAHCPHHAIVRAEDQMLLTDDCVRCGTCVDFCSAEARAIAGRFLTVRQILDEIERDTVFYDESGGGVTFSGGEPLRHPEILEVLLHKCRARRIHSAIETCGAAPREAVLRLCSHADIVLYDLKLIDSDRHREYTGAPNRNILENLVALAAVHHNLVVRVPLVPGVNDRPADAGDFRRFLAGIRFRRLDIVPYHRVGVGKYRRLGREYLLEDTQPPSEEEMAELAATLEAAGIPVGTAH
jgi:pyruvate formate lyase activating enzyme